MTIQEMKDALASAKTVFKTREQFKKEYGENWRSTVNWSSTSVMDILFGQSRSHPLATRFQINRKMGVYEDLNNNELEKSLQFMEENYAARFNVTNEAWVDFGLEAIVKIAYTKDKRTYAFYTVLSPTGNCQLGSIVYFNQLLTSLEVNDIKDIFQYLKQYKHGKRMYYFDVHRQHKPKLQQLNTVFLQDYSSTNGSLMTCGIFKV